MNQRPGPEEAKSYYFRYIDRVPEVDIVEFLNQQQDTALRLWRAIPEEQAAQPYAAGKWTFKQLIAHLNDWERIFVARAMTFARGVPGPMPGFEPDEILAASGADVRSWSSHVEEFEAVRRSTITFFRYVPEQAWARRGMASGDAFSVRALAHLAAGHVEHHLTALS